MKYLNEKNYFIFLFPIVFYAIKIEEYFEFFRLEQNIAYMLYFISSYFVFYFIAKKIFQKNSNFNIIFFISLLIFVYFGYIQEVVFEKFLLKKFIFLIPFLISLVLLIYKVIKNKTKLKQEMVLYFNVLCIGIICLQTFLILIKTQKENVQYFPFTKLEKSKIKPNRNIYFLLLDEYAGKETLKRVYNFDNSNFYNELRKRNFFVPDTFSANYDKTPLCMASLFNLNYINKERVYPYSNYFMYLKFFKSINQNPLFPFLKKNGYHVFNNSPFEINNKKSKFNFERFPQVAEIIYKDIFILKLWNTFSYFFIGEKFKIQRYFNHRIMKKHENNILLIKDLHNNIHNNKKQKFVYTHLLIPHAPYYCDSNGVLYNDKEILSNNKLNYIPYIKYGNNQILKMADEIIKIDSGAIIIFMSDHGDRYAIKKEISMSYESHAFDNFFAIKTGDSEVKNFYNLKSNVNVFRILLNTYFGQNLSLISDSVFNIDEAKNTATIFQIK